MAPIQLSSILVFVCSFLTAALVTLVYDIVVINAHGPEASISESMRALTAAAPLIPVVLVFLLGLILGGLGVHFWWPR